MRLLTAMFVSIGLVAVGCSQPITPTSPTAAAALPHQSTTAASSTVSTTAHDITVPVHGRLQGTYAGSGAPPFITVHVEAGGTASLLGAFTFDSTHVVNFDDFTGVGTATLVAANGDVLMVDLTGVARPQDVPGVFFIVETLQVTGGAGRFEGATGVLTIERLSFPSGPDRGTTSGTIAGTLSLPRGSH